MKREALRHPKMYDLAARLSCSRAEAIGYLTLLFDYTADVAIAGDIGKWPDGAIARACDWPGSPPEFIGALVESGWLDTDDVHRLVLHDWSHHAQQWIRQKASKLGVPLLGGSNGSFSAVASTVAAVERTVEGTVEGTVERTVERAASRDRTEPNQTKPNQTFPDRTGGDRAGPDPDRPQDDIDRQEPILAEYATRTVVQLPAGKLRGSVFSPLTEANLRSTATLVEWHARQLSAKQPVVGDTEAHLLLVISAAIHASEMQDSQVTKSRVAVFIGIVRKKAWDRVLYCLPKAAERLSEFRQRVASSKIT